MMSQGAYERQKKFKLIALLNLNLHRRNVNVILWFMCNSPLIWRHKHPFEATSIKQKSLHELDGGDLGLNRGADITSLSYSAARLTLGNCVMLALVQKRSQWITLKKGSPEKWSRNVSISCWARRNVKQMKRKKRLHYLAGNPTAHLKTSSCSLRPAVLHSYCTHTYTHIQYANWFLCVKKKITA